MLRQDSLADGFFYLISGSANVYQETIGDFQDFDFFQEKQLLQDIDGKYKDKGKEKEEARNSNAVTQIAGLMKGNAFGLRRSQSSFSQ